MHVFFSTRWALFGACLCFTFIVSRTQTIISHTPGIFDRHPHYPPHLHVQETQLGTKRHTEINYIRHASPQTLILTLAQDAESWGQNHDQPRRNFTDFLQLIQTMGYGADDLSLGLLTSSVEEYYKYIRILTDAPYLLARATVIYAPDSPTSDRVGRHSTKVQTLRRKTVALYRNYLMLSSLRAEQHVLWIDSDIYSLPKKLLPTFIKSSARNYPQPLPGLLTIRCRQDLRLDYDRNAWAGFGHRPSNKELDTAAEKKESLPTDWAKSMSQLVEGTHDDDLIPLDSVGGTVLFINAELVRTGLSFPPYRVVGTTWEEMDGTDGIETEGLCFVAKNLGYGCYALGGKWESVHTDM